MKTLHIREDLTAQQVERYTWEIPPQGDMRLVDVRRQIGEQVVLFGNIEASEIEMLSPPQFEARVRQALTEGTAGEEMTVLVYDLLEDREAESRTWGMGDFRRAAPEKPCKEPLLVILRDAQPM